MKNSLSILIIIITLSASPMLRADATGIIVSKLELSSTCEAIIPKVDGGRESMSITGALTEMVLKSIVGGGIAFVSSWLEKWKDSYEGADAASTVGLFFCEAEGGVLGHPRDITYTRTQLARNDGETNTELLKLVSKIDAIPNHGSLGDSVLTLQLDEVKYSKTLAKKGKSKDLTVNYSFAYADADGAEVVVSTEPIVLSRITAGDHYTSMSATTSVLKIGKVASSSGGGESGAKTFAHSPVVLRIDLAESQVGNGIKLAAQITSSLAERLTENQQDLTGKIVQVIVGDKSAPPTGAGVN